MTVRDGNAYLQHLEATPRDVWIQGRRVTNVVKDKAFLRPAREIAALYDLQCSPALQDTMTYVEGGQRYGMAFLTPRSIEDLVRRRKSFEVWADQTFGMLGRSPDFLNTTVMAFAEAADFFGQKNPIFGENIRNYYKHCRDNDLFLTHALVNPQVDRSRISSEQEDPFIHLGVVEETKQGLIVRGAKMLATHGPLADELMVYPSPGIRTGDERYVLGFGIPIATPGLKLICREPFDAADQNEWDHPLGARFEEPDAVVIFDDVLVPWERVFMYGDPAIANAMPEQTGQRNFTGHQTAVRGVSKARFMCGVAASLAQTVKADAYLHVQEQLGEILAYLPLIEGAIFLAEAEAKPTPAGVYRPSYGPLQAIRYHFPKFYERMVQVTQVLGAGGLLLNPTAADMQSDIREDIDRYYKGAGVEAQRRIQLYKLAWDATGTQFGQRMLQYERYYAGDPVRVGAGYYLSNERLPDLRKFVESALTELPQPVKVPRTAQRRR